MRDQLEEAADVLERIVGPAEASVTKAHESVRAGGDFDAQFMVIGVEEMLCRIYRELDRPDAVLEVVRRFPNSSLDLQRAEALEHKGLEDAALLVYSAYLEAVEREISTDEERGTFTLGRRDLARYAKARLLIADDRLRPARAELARLYADSPDFEDSYRLRAKLERPPSNVGRKAIPEDVRHAVWRRDEGRCTQCSSQEDLEFDHIIPLSRGGSNAERNLQLLCERCNREKGATI